MSTVPAQIFSAAALAAEIAALRLIPGVCGVSGSSSSPRTTRTPVRRQSPLFASPVMSRPPARLYPRTGPFGGADHELRSVEESQRPLRSGCHLPGYVSIPRLALRAALMTSIALVIVAAP